MNMRNLDKDLSWIKDYLYDNYGLDFSDRCHNRLQYKINKRLRKLDCGLGEYKTRIQNEPAEIPRLLEAVSTNKTFFYREPEHWDYLLNRIIPQWKENNRDPQLWSAACSSGEEPYTAAMLIDHETDSNLDDYRILATDISHEMLSQGVRGQYKESDLDKIREEKPGLFRRYFNRNETPKDHYQIKESLKEKITFRSYNLNRSDQPFLNRFDLILCRNVLIYFDTEVTINVISKLEKALNPGGYLFIGHTDSILDIDHNLERIRPSIYRYE